MKTLLLTAYDEKMAPIGQLTEPRMAAWANRFGLTFMCDNKFPDGKVAYWHKVPLIIKALEVFDRVIWLDADQMITNPYVSTVLRLPETGFHASKDWGTDALNDSYFSMCGFICHRDSLPLFQWLEHNEAEWIDKPFPEQEPMRYLYRSRSILSSPEALCEMMTYPRRVFNAVPKQVHESVPEPWQGGDWCAHITMVDVPRRVEIFHEIRKQIEPDSNA
jgi:hypothetical protein